MFFRIAAAAVLASFAIASPVPQMMDGMMMSGSPMMSSTPMLGATAPGLNATAAVGTAIGDAAVTVAQDAGAAAQAYNATGHPGVAALVSTLANSAANTAGTAINAGLPVAVTPSNTTESAIITAGTIGQTVNALGLNGIVNAAASALNAAVGGTPA